MKPFVLVLVALASGCTVATAPPGPLRCGPAGECLEGQVCGTDGMCYAGYFAVDDTYDAVEDTALVVDASRGVLANDRRVLGLAVTLSVATPPMHGTLALDASGGFTYTPVADFAGEDRFTYRAEVSGAPSRTANVRVVVAARPDAPVARDDRYEGTEDTPLAVDAARGVLTNDTDADADALIAVLITGPASGTLALERTGAFTYTPPLNWNGEVTFTYAAEDPGGLRSAPAQVTLAIGPVNDAPTAGDDTFIVPLNTALTVPFWLGVLLNDGDPEREALTAMLVDAPTGGVLALSPDGSFTYIPNTAFRGEDRFTYRAVDATGAVSSPATVRITVELPRQLPIARVSVSSQGVAATTNADQGVSISADGQLVAFGTTARNLVASDENDASDIFVHNRANGVTTRESVSMAGVEGNGASYSPSLSADGRWLAFSSSATNLVPDDRNGIPDVFVRERATGRLTRVLGPGGVEPDGPSATPVLSATGRYVAFVSSAINLVAGANAFSQVYLVDRETRAVERISIGSAGAVGDGDSSAPVLSTDGRFVAFLSEASNLVAGDTNGIGDIFVRDRVAGTTTRVSVTDTGEQANRMANGPTISADGRYVVFSSSATNLAPEHPRVVTSVFIHDRERATTRLVSVGATDSTSHVAAVDGSGRYVAFVSGSALLAPGDNNGTSDLFVRDLVLGVTRPLSVHPDGRFPASSSGGPIALSANGAYVAFGSRASELVGDALARSLLYVAPTTRTSDVERVSVGPGGVEGSSDTVAVNAGNESTRRLALSHDGRYCAFASRADNLVPGDTNGLADAFRRDRQAGTVTTASVGLTGGELALGVSEVSLSPDGRWLAFVSSASTLVSGDSNAVDDVFMRDLEAGATLWVSRAMGPADGLGSSRGVHVGGAGRCVVFTSTVPNLVAGDVNGVADVYLYDLEREQIERISVGLGGVNANGASDSPFVTPDCRQVAFVSVATNLVPNDNNAWGDVFVRDRTLSTTSRVSVTSTGAEGNGASYSPALSDDGRVVAFESDATNFQAGDGAGLRDVFVHDRNSGATTMLRGPSGFPNRQSREPQVSGDGRYVLFRTAATNLGLPGDGVRADAYVYDRTTAQLARASLAGSTPLDAPILHATLSRDGRVVSLVTASSGFASPSTPGRVHVYTRSNPLFEAR